MSLKWPPAVRKVCLGADIWQNQSSSWLRLHQLIVDRSMAALTFEVSVKIFVFEKLFFLGGFDHVKVGWFHAPFPFVCPRMQNCRGPTYTTVSALVWDFPYAASVCIQLLILHTCDLLCASSDVFGLELNSVEGPCAHLVRASQVLDIDAVLPSLCISPSSVWRRGCARWSSCLSPAVSPTASAIVEPRWNVSVGVGVRGGGSEESEHKGD